MARVIALANQKGGVGKTATTVNLGAALVERGRRVLVVDLDPQGHATEGLGMAQAQLPRTLGAVLTAQAEVGRDLVVERAGGLALVASSLDHFLTEQRLVALPGREMRLKRALTVLGAGFDYVLIDCPPTLGALTDNALVAAAGDGSGVLVPMESDPSSVHAAGILLDQLDSLREALTIEVTILGLVLTKVDDTVVSKRVLAGLAESVPVPVLAQFRRRVKVREAWDSGRTVLEYDPQGDTAEGFRALAAAVEEAGRG